MLYVGDHGESLGEHGLYLHGLPYLIAPEQQKHIPMLMWFGDGFDNKEERKVESLRARIDNRYSHDNIFHTILGLFEVNTGVYNKRLDILNSDENH